MRKPYNPMFTRHVTNNDANGLPIITKGKAYLTSFHLDDPRDPNNTGRRFLRQVDAAAVREDLDWFRKNCPTETAKHNTEQIKFLEGLLRTLEPPVDANAEIKVIQAPVAALNPPKSSGHTGERLSGPPFN